MEETLLEYISVCKDRGLDDSEIIANLLETGWKEEDILEGIKMIEDTEFPVAPLSPETRKKMEATTGTGYIKSLYIMRPLARFVLIVCMSLFVNNYLDFLLGAERIFDSITPFWILAFISGISLFTLFFLAVMIKRWELKNSAIQPIGLKIWIPLIERGIIFVVFILFGLFILLNNKLDLLYILKLIYLFIVLFVIKKFNAN